MSTDPLPRYQDLPIRPELPEGSSWGVWGEQDVFGTLNLLTPQKVVEAASLVRSGSVFSLNWDMELPDPPLFGRAGFSHDVRWLPGKLGHDDELTGWNTQSSSQWDGFRHMCSVEHGFYGGVDDEEHGVHHWARRGIVGRAVLVDIARWRESVGRPLDPTAPDAIQASEIAEAAEAQGVQLLEGDILLIRTGWVSWYKGLDAAGRKTAARHLATPGLSGSESTAEFLWDLHISAIAADNPALEVYPPVGPDGKELPHSALEKPSDLINVYAHMRLLPLLGIPIGEMFDLDALAKDCAQDGIWAGLFTSAPLNLRAGVASPPNALVIK